jgi:hypothetical protein
MLTTDDVVVIAEREWRSIGVIRADRAALAADLRNDLTAAEADGVRSEQLVGDDIPAFARATAMASGVRRLQPGNKEILVTALAGAAPGLLADFLLLWLLPALHIEPPWWRALNDTNLVLAEYGVIAMSIYFGALAAVAIRLRHVPTIKRTVVTMALLLPLAPLLILALSLAYYPTLGLHAAMPVTIFIAVAYTAVTLARRTTTTSGSRIPVERPTTR